MAGIQEVYDLVAKGKAKKVAAAVTEALDAGCDPTEILNKGMIAAMDEVGAKFKSGEIFVPEMLVAAKGYEKRRGGSETSSGIWCGRGCRKGNHRYGVRRPA